MIGYGEGMSPAENQKEERRDERKIPWRREVSPAMRWEFGIFGILLIVTIVGKLMSWILRMTW